MGPQEAGRPRAGGAGSRLGGARPPCPVRPGPARPRCPRGASAGTQRRALTSAAPRPPALRLRSRRQVVFGRCGSYARQTDCCSGSEAARAQGAPRGGRQAPGAALGLAVLARKWACRQRAAQEQTGRLRPPAAVRSAVLTVRLGISQAPQGRMALGLDARHG